MALNRHQVVELTGVAMLLASVALQMFYLDPLKREIEWRLAAFSNQQTAARLTRTAYDNQVTLLRAVKATDDQVKAAEVERDKALSDYRTADANISDFMIAKEPVEDTLQWITIGLFALGTALTTIGRVGDMRRRGAPAP